MKKNVLKITIENIDFFENNKFEIDFTNQMQVTGFNNGHPYYHLDSSIYLPKYLAFVGVNASGKTTIIEVLGEIFNFYLYNYSFRNSFLYKYMKSESLKITFIYEYRNKIFKIVSTISKKNNIKEILLNNEKGNYIIEEEILYEKNLNKLTSKIHLFETGFVELYKRSELDSNIKTFLSEDISMIRILNHHSMQLVVTSSTNLFKSGRFYNQEYSKSDIAVIKYLDPSIKEIKEVKLTNIEDLVKLSDKLYLIEFETGLKLEVTRPQLGRMLSDGTLKGINLFREIKRVLKTGGYYIIDEIEVHLNRTIILDIIKLFEDNLTNPYNAVLIFSTHYTEILDSFSRNDQIFYIYRNENYKIKTINYSEISRKNILKRSDVYFADTFNLGTAISYQVFLNMKKSFIINENEEDE